ncbi:MAG: hypothetical protein COA42_04550, partial [Alteromonadaceae bacterium]
MEDENSIKLIKAYGRFLKDESEMKLNNSLKEVKCLKNKVEGMSVELKVKDNIQKIFRGNQFEEGGATFYEIIIDANAKFSVEKEELLNKLNVEGLVVEVDLFDIKNISKKLNFISEGIKKEVDRLSEEEEKKSDEIKRVEKSLKHFK